MISVVIPIKLTENEYWDFLPYAVKSVLRQTYTDYELIISQYENDVAEGRNKGIEKCNGEWILCLDADDVLHPTFLEKCLQLKDNFDIICTDGYINNDVFIARPDLDFKEWNRILSCSLFKKEVWDKYHFNETLPAYEDWDWNLRAIENGFKIGKVHEKLVKISDRPTSRNKEGIKRHNELKEKICR